MDTDALIAQLARDTRPVPSHALERRLAGALAGGAGVSALLLVAALGVRPDLAAAAAGTSFWLKLAYTAAAGGAALLLTIQLARPDSENLRFAWLPAAPLLGALVFAAAELAGAVHDRRVELLLEPSWTCAALIGALALPIYGALVAALRRLAPTRLAAAGAAAGATSGSFAATLYGLYCQQVSATFVVTRYTLAIVMVAAAGAWLGPRLLRW